MRTPTSALLLACAIGLTPAAASLAGCTTTTTLRDDDAVLVLVNESSFEIIEVRMAGTVDETFGPDLLGFDVLLPGEELEVFDIPCDFYDILLVDELGAECIIFDVNLCLNVVSFVVDDLFLTECVLPANQEATRDDDAAAEA